MEQSPNDLVTKQEAVKLSGKSYSTLSRWIEEGKLQKYRIGHRVHLSKRQLTLALLGNLQEHNEKTNTPPTMLTITSDNEQSKRTGLSSELPQNETQMLYERMLDGRQKQIDTLETQNQSLRDRVDSLTDKVTSQTDRLAEAYEKVFTLDSILKSLPKVLPEEATTPSVDVEQLGHEEHHEQGVHSEKFTDEQWAEPSSTWAPPPEPPPERGVKAFVKRKIKERVDSVLGF